MTGGLFVVGDCLLDVDLIGSVDKLCQDAPAPVLDVETERVRAGGAGLAARLAAADGAKTTLLTCLSDDLYALRLKARLAGLVTIAGSSRAGTAVRTRLLAGDRTIGRVDRGGSGAPPAEVSEEMLDALLTADAVLVCDHGRGMAGNGKLRGVLGWLVNRVPVVWAVHPRGAEPVVRVAVATLNLAAAGAMTGITGDPVTAAGRAASELRTRWRAESVAVTLGAGGALVQEQSAPCVVPANSVVVKDSYGAGYRFAATLATRLMHGASVAGATRSAVAMATRFLVDGGVAALHAGQRRSGSLSTIRLVSRA
jgi:bifunctional ADP-heptose synthase (sugar kinase/adenylyltransferase)